MGSDPNLLHEQKILKQQEQQEQPFIGGLFCRTTRVSWYRKGKTSQDLNDTRDDGGVLGCSGISWIVCKQSAPH